MRHEAWSSRIGFLLASVGAAVGLGNIWRFPYVAGTNGGGAFVAVYVIAVACIAVPTLMAEMAMGRRGAMSPPSTLARLTEEADASTAWRGIGWACIPTCLLMMSFYSVIAGWVLAYLPRAASGAFTGVSGEAVQSDFDALLGDPWTLVFWHSAFVLITVAPIALGLRRGIERLAVALTPALFSMLVVLLVYALLVGDAARAFAFLWSWDLSRITPGVVLAAVGQALFSTAVAGGTIMTYAAYLPRDVSLPRSAAVIAASDTTVALVAGLVVFPIAFANGVDPAEGAGLTFVALPLAFGGIPGGTIFATAFFLLLAFAALTSSVGMLEPVVSWLEEQPRIGRRRGAALAGFAAWLIGLGSVLSFNVWSGVHPLAAFQRFDSATFFDLVDFLVSQVLLPILAVAMTLFAGWRMSQRSILEELGLGQGPLFRLWQLAARMVAPASVGAILVTNLM